MRYCDICGRSELELSKLSPKGSDARLIDLDYVSICQECHEKVKSDPVYDITGEIPAELRALVRRNAGEICMALKLPDEAPYQSILEHASKMQDMQMSAWVLFLILLDGSTIWKSPDGLSKAIVSQDGLVKVEDV